MRTPPEIGVPGWRRGFWCLMATQFQNAFSDNALKNLVVLLVMARPMSEDDRHGLVALVGALFAAALCTSCDANGPELGDDARLVVGERVFTSLDLAEVDEQLGPWASTRFRGPEGQRTLMEALTDAELMAQAAVAAGHGDDPRVSWALVEELAALELAGELERRVPLAETIADTAALRAEWEANPEAYSEPERRSIRGVLIGSFAEADAAHRKLAAGEVTLEELGAVAETKLLAFDPKERPGFDVFLFDPKLQVGDVLPSPVLRGISLMVGVVNEIQPAKLREFDDPEVQTKLAEAVHARRLEAAKAAYLEELGLP